MGDALGEGNFISQQSRDFGMRVLSLEYPLCPEASASDATAYCVAAYQYLVEDLGVAPKNIVITGCSGGGQLALLTLQVSVLTS